MAVNIDWSLASTPNILGAYTGAREKAEQNVLLRQQAEAQTQQRQVENQRADTRLGMDQAKATREQGTADAASWQKAAQAVGHLKGVLGTSGPEGAAAAFDQIAPGLGLPPDQAAQMRAALVQDPKGFLDHVGALAEQKLQFISTGNGGVAVGDQNTGQIQQAIQPTYEQEYAVVPEGGKLIPKPRPGAPVAASPVAAPDGAGSSVPRNMRNNNPGNIEDGPFAQSLPGYKGSDGRFAIFDDPKAGGQAQVALLGSYGRRGINTVEGAINRWAPASDGNDTAAYTKFVADKIGVKPGDKIDLTDPVIASDMASAIQQFEGGGQSKSNAAAPPQAQPGDPAGTIYGAPKPTTRPASAAEKAQYGIPADVPAQMKPDGSIDVISGTAATLKRVPAAIQQGHIGNNQSIKQIDEAIAAIQKNPEALGWGNYAGDAVTQRVSGPAGEGGVATRAPVANIGSLIIHDRSGAAVTASETPRLLPFIPQVTDKPNVAVQKLQALRKQLENANSEIEVQYGEESGYSPMGGSGRDKPAPAPKPAAQAKPTTGQLPPQAVAQLQEGHATTFGNGQIWTKEGGKPKRLR